MVASLRASSPIWVSEVSLAPRGFAARSRVLERLASLAQIGELARRLHGGFRSQPRVANLKYTGQQMSWNSMP